MENWVPNQETQIDDEDLFVDNTQVEGTSQATKPKKRKYVQRAACWADYDVIHIDKLGIANAKSVELCSKSNPVETVLLNKKKALLNLFVVGELLFKFVENELFIELTNAFNGKVVLPCRTTISNRVTDYYLEEKAKLFKFFSNPLSNVHLTTDCWISSCQRSSYMVVTAHFIDEDWVMHKRIINFKSLDSHKGEDIGCTLLTCLQEWGITNCMQKVVKYIRNSTQRIQRFKECMKELNVESKKFV
uniref:hAT-like transposase RNase-H fold domain-containing protein n=1 Tax=Lactuca sativa TaxID=4236 RepID=A0A9R1W6L9_LACSA|nr:hypothetical protein LSAT_V11C300149270 [Lactuca sativa]